MAEVRPLSKASLPGLNAEHKFQVWNTLLILTSLVRQENINERDLIVPILPFSINTKKIAVYQANINLTILELIAIQT